MTAGWDLKRSLRAAPSRWHTRCIVRAHIHRHLLPLVALVLCASACGTGDIGLVRSNFASTNTCPEDRFQVTPRADLELKTPADWNHDVPEPPAEIAADPARLAMWQREKSDDTDEGRRLRH